MEIAAKTLDDSFLAGGGEMGALTRQKDWGHTTLGHIQGWPQSLRTTLGIILHSKLPMFLFWGTEHTCFYNDAYRPSLLNQGKHPGILGMPGQQAWPETWVTIQPLIDKVMDGGEACLKEDQLTTIYIDKKIEDVYRTFSYSPVYNEAGKVAGVFVTCTDSTLSVKNRQVIEESKDHLQFAIEAAELGTFDYNPLSGKFSANERLRQWFGLPASNEVAIHHAINTVAENDRERVLNAIENALKFSSGGYYDIQFSIIHPSTKKEKIVHAKGIASFNQQQIAYRLNGTVRDITEQRSAELEMLQALKRIKENEKRFQAAINAIDGILWTNNATGEMIGEQAGWETLTGQTFSAYQGYGWSTMVHPEDAQPTIIAWKNAVEKKTNFVFEHRVKIHSGAYRHFSVKAIPVFDQQGEITEWVGVHTDITNQKEATEAINNAFLKTEQSEKKFRDTVMQAPVGIVLMKGPSFIVEMVNESYLQLVDKKEEDFVGRPLFETIPEVQQTIEPLLTGVLTTGTPYYGNEFEVTINRSGEKKTGYFNLLYQPLRSIDGIITGVMAVAFEVTRQVEAKFSLEENKEKFSKLVMQSPIAMTIWRGKDYIIEIANEAMLNNIWRKDPTEIIGKKALEVFPELFEQKYPALLKKVLTQGIAHKENEAVVYVQGNDGMKKFYLDFEYSPLFEKDNSISGIMITVTDVTQKVAARLQLEDAEARLRLAAEGTGLATWDLDLQTRHIIYSPRLAVIFGYHESMVLTHPQMREHIHPEDLHSIVEPAFVTALETGVYLYEARVVHPDKTIRWIRTQGKVIFDENKKPRRMLGTMRDITEQKNYQQNLEESEQKFRLLADSMPQLIWTGDPAGNLTYFSNTVYTYAGLTPPQLHEAGWLLIVHPEDRQENIKQWMQAIQSGEPFLFEHRFRRYDGEYRWQLSRAIPQKDEKGNIQMWVGTSTDIDEIKKHDQQKDDFIKMASHELKTPVTTIKGYVQLLLKMNSGGNDPFLASSLLTIDKQIFKLTKLITDLLDVTKIETGSLELKKETFLIAATVREIAEELETTTQTHTITIHQHANPVVYADKDRIAQVLINLFTNAIKYSPKAAEIIVDISIEEDNILISVQDFGIGISQEDLTKIFERFYRAAGKDEKTFPGFGIGLFIVNEIIGLHNGKIWVKSEKDKGSVFYVSLPLNS